LSILCDIYQLWTHFKCTNLTKSEFTRLGNSNVPNFCQNCYSDISPFHSLSNQEFSNELNTIGINKYSKIKLPDLIPSKSNNCYLQTSDFCQQYINNNDFLLIHVNIRSLNKNFERLEELLLKLGKKPDISETKLKSKFNTYLKGYSFVQNNYNTNAGEVGFFVKDTLDFKNTNDFNINVIDCEEIWVQIKFKNTEKTFAVLYKTSTSTCCHIQNYI